MPAGPPMLLLDTHVPLWVAAAPDRLGRRCRALIDQATHVYVSSVSSAEMVLKHMVGRLTVPSDFGRWLDEQGFRQLPFTREHAASLMHFPELARHDPFDRMLLAQALSEGLTFVTADRRLLALDRDWVVDARS